MDTEGIECHRRRPSTPLRWDDHQVLYEANEFYCGATCISSNPVCSRAIIQLFCNCFGIGIVVLAAATIIRERWDVCRVRGLPFAGCWWWGRWWRPGRCWPNIRLRDDACPPTGWEQGAINSATAPSLRDAHTKYLPHFYNLFFHFVWSKMYFKEIKSRFITIAAFQVESLKFSFFSSWSSSAGN